MLFLAVGCLGTLVPHKHTHTHRQPETHLTVIHLGSRASMVEDLLSLCKHEEYPVYLLKAIDVATVLLNQVSYLDRQVPTEIAARLYDEVDIEFHVDPRAAYGWTQSPDKPVVHINKVMGDRLELLTKRRKKDTHEYRSIVLMIAVVIAEGCANLLWHWLQASAKDKRERGKRVRAHDFRADLETGIFKGYCRLLVKKPIGAAATEWTEKMPVFGFVIQKPDRDVGLNATELRKFMLVAPADIQALCPLKQMTLKRPKGSVIHLDIHTRVPGQQGASAKEQAAGAAKINSELPARKKLRVD